MAVVENYFAQKQTEQSVLVIINWMQKQNWRIMSMLEIY